MRFRSLSSVSLLCLALAACAGAPGDCDGKNGSCSVAEHDAKQPVAAGDFDQKVRDYIMSNPKVIQDALNEYRRQQTVEAAQKARETFLQSHDAIYADPADIVIGDPAGDVTVVEWLDYSCPVCHSEEETIQHLLAADAHIRIVIKTMAFLAPGSTIAAKAALASMRQGSPAEFHHLLMTDKTPEGQLAEPRIMELAAKAHLNVAKLKADMEAPEIKAQIDKTQALAKSLNVHSTPTLFVGPNMQRPGALPLEALTQAVALARTPAQPPKAS